MAALGFLRAVREDETLRERIRQLDPADGLEPVVRLAVAEGFAIDADTLRAAHAHDWALRLAHFVAASRLAAVTAAREPTTVAVVKSASSSK